MIESIFGHINKTYLENLQFHIHFYETKYIVKIIFNILINLILLKIIYIDLKKKIINNKLLLILLSISFCYAYFSGVFLYFILGMCTYHIPLLVLYIIEDFFNKPLIGFGDIKLMMVIGGIVNTFLFLKNNFYLKNFYEVFIENWEYILTFYKITYFLSGFFCIFYIFWLKIKYEDRIYFLKKNNVINKKLDYHNFSDFNNKYYIPFSPFLIISFWIVCLMR